MSNNYFQFKLFRVEQDKCAMKVSTDACIQGAWTPVSQHVKNILDIGAGTGLLSLMLAQKKEAVHIDAIELDELATDQAKENFRNSPWKETIRIVNADAREYSSENKYDLIISNPPFFNNSLLGDSDARNVARHGISFTYTDLAKAIKTNLAENGYTSVLLPYASYEEWSELAATHGLYVYKSLLIKPLASSAYNRVVCLCGFNKPDEIITEELVIYEKVNEYTAKSKGLLKPYYLKL